jgi:predicted nucleotidyltransferase
MKLTPGRYAPTGLAGFTGIGGRDHVERVATFTGMLSSFAMGTERAESDIDVMVIGGISLEEVLAILRGPEETLSREINVSLYDLQEIQRRVKDSDPFIMEVLGGSKIMLIGNEDELRRTTS